MALIPLKDWAIKNGIKPDTARQKALRGKLPAKKVGREWLIEEDVINIDNRITSNKYANNKQWIVSTDCFRNINPNEPKEKELPANAVIFCGRARVFVSAASVQEAIAIGKKLLAEGVPDGYKISNCVGATPDCQNAREVSDKYYTVESD